nr:sialidase-like isoform X2 [Procambarus clarkii]
MDGFFFSIFLAVCIAAAIVIRFLCTRINCRGREVSQDDEIIISRGTTPVIVASQTSRQQQQQMQQLSRAITDSPLVTRNGEVFTIYTFSTPSTPEVERSSRTPPPPKYSSLADSPPKYEDLFPLTDICTSCKSNISLPEEYTLPVIALQHQHLLQPPYDPHLPAFASIAAATIKVSSDLSPEPTPSPSPTTTPSGPLVPHDSVHATGPSHSPVHSPVHSPAHSPVHSPSHSPAHSTSHSPAHSPSLTHRTIPTANTSTFDSTQTSSDITPTTWVMPPDERPSVSTFPVTRDGQ